MNAKAQKPVLVDEDLVEALSHPTRAYALNVMTQRPASATDIARDLDKDPSAVAYHINRLLDLKCIEEVETRKVRGATEIFYRATVRHYFDEDSWKAVPKGKRLAFTMDVLGLISKDVNVAIEAKTVDACDRHLSRTLLNLDDAGWLEAYELLRVTMEELITIRERSVKRMSKSDEKPRVTSVSLMQFEIPRTGRPLTGA